MAQANETSLVLGKDQFSSPVTITLSLELKDVALLLDTINARTRLLELCGYLGETYPRQQTLMRELEEVRGKIHEAYHEQKSATRVITEEHPVT